MLKNLKIWNRFQKEIDEDDLKYISQADRGDDAQEHFLALKTILVSGELPEQLLWEPKEVLELVSWGHNSSEYAYFCSVVLLAASEKSQQLDGQVEKLIIAIDTANLLGQGRTEDLYEFIKNLLVKINIKKVGEDYLYFHLSLYIIASILNKPSDEIEKLISNVLNAEQAVAGHDYHKLHRDIFAYTCFDQRISIWRSYYAKYANALETRRKVEFYNLFGYRS